jgi:hypothetical protein
VSALRETRREPAIGVDLVVVATELRTLRAASQSRRYRGSPPPLPSREAVIEIVGVCVTFRAPWFEWEHPCSQELNTRAAVHGALESFEPIDLAFRLTAALRLRDGVPHGLDVAHQRS